MRILVATENTLPARAAIRFGARIAAATGGEVVALAIGTQRVVSVARRPVVLVRARRR